MYLLAKIICFIQTKYFYAHCAVVNGHSKKNKCSGGFGGPRKYKCENCKYCNFYEK